MYLYLVQCNEYYKIGVASSIGGRLASLQTGNPVQLVVRACYEFENSIPVEQSLHQRYSGKRLRGEWFRLDGKDLDDIDVVCDLLGGARMELGSVAPSGVNEGADSVSELDDPEAMFSDGWRIEIQRADDVHPNTYWSWRRGSAGNREFISGGRVDNAPRAIRSIIEERLQRSVKEDSSGGYAV